MKLLIKMSKNTSSMKVESTTNIMSEWKKET